MPRVRHPQFHNLVSRHQPAWAIGTKTMLRGFDSASESHQSPVPSFVRKCAYAAFERAVEPLHSAISSFRPLNSSFPRRRESRGGVWVANDAHATPPINLDAGSPRAKRAEL